MKNAIASAVYVMTNGSRVKIGRSLAPDLRRKYLEWGAGEALTIIYETEVRDDASFIESQAHRMLAHKRIAGEWFDVGADEAIQTVKAAIDVIVERKQQLAARRPRRKRQRFIGGSQPFRLYVPADMLVEIDAFADEHKLTRSHAINVLAARGIEVMRTKRGGAP